MVCGNPAPGFRHHASGAPGSVGYGYSWASTVSGTNGMNLNFRSQLLYTSRSDYRAYGLQLRCLSE